MAYFTMASAMVSWVTLPSVTRAASAATMARVDLKKAAKRRTRVAAAKPIGAERGERGLDIGCYQLRIGAHIICCGNDGTCPRKTAGDVAPLPGGDPGQAGFFLRPPPGA